MHTQSSKRQKIDGNHKPDVHQTDQASRNETHTSLRSSSRKRVPRCLPNHVASEELDEQLGGGTAGSTESEQSDERGFSEGSIFDDGSAGKSKDSSPTDGQTSIEEPIQRVPSVMAATTLPASRKPGMTNVAPTAHMIPSVANEKRTEVATVAPSKSLHTMSAAAPKKPLRFCFVKDRRIQLWSEGTLRGKTLQFVIGNALAFTGGDCIEALNCRLQTSHREVIVRISQGDENTFEQMREMFNDAIREALHKYGNPVKPFEIWI